MGAPTSHELQAHVYIFLGKESSSLDDIFAIVGIIRTPGGLEACVLSKSKGMQSCYVVESIDIAKFYLGDTVISMDAEGPFCSVGSEAFVWAIQLLDGELLSWSVPYINYKHSEVSLKVSHFILHVPMILLTEFRSFM